MEKNRIGKNDKTMFKEILLGLGIIGVAILIIVIVLLPLVCTIILGTYFATVMGLSGIVWWAFVIVFYLIVMGLLGVVA